MSHGQQLEQQLEQQLDILRDIEFLRDVTDEALERLEVIAQVVEFCAGETVFRENERAKDVYLIVKGKVSLAICEPKVGCRQIMEVRDGELFGWSPLVGRRLLSDSAITLTPTKFVAFSGERLLDLGAADTEFGFLFMTRIAHVLAERLDAVRLEFVKKCGYQLPTVQIESD